MVERAQSSRPIVNPADAEPSAQPRIRLCSAEALENSGRAVAFEVIEHAQRCSAFAVRYAGVVYAYLNRCSHVPMEMDFLPNQFFDSTGHWLMCATHGAMYAPQTGQCGLGPCRGGLVKIETSEAEGVVYWHTSGKFQPGSSP
jgi:nitrite reductase/ring-hydroxylating ferredoxin subunit